jgi:Zn-finger nucleic acid-binding protein
MQCPIDGTELNLTYREGVEIDYCPKCRGIWLDRGELDKIIELAAAAAGARPAAAAAPPMQVRRDDDDDRYDYDDDDRYPKKKKRSSSFLGDLFDF